MRFIYLRSVDMPDYLILIFQRNMFRDGGLFLQTLSATCLTWGLTALGAAVVFFFPSDNNVLLDGSLGAAGGVMIAASFWSLLSPALEMAESDYGKFAFVPVCIGFAAGAGFVHFVDSALSTFSFEEFARASVSNENSNSSESSSKRKQSNGTADAFVARDDWSPLRPSKNNVDGCVLKLRAGAQSAVNSKANEDYATPTPINSKETVHILLSKGNPGPTNVSTWRRVFLLIIAVTVHNIPEGAAVGVGFAAIGKSAGATFERARNLAIGIGIQNFPEGLAVSLPLAGLGYSKWKSFWYGQLSGMVEPFAAVLGAFAVTVMQPVLPYALSFAAGAMIFVVCDDIIPEANQNGNGKLASWCTIAGFLVMMTLDVFGFGE